jgi:alginate O-acetyltransferase complex protein AlgI
VVFSSAFFLFVFLPLFLAVYYLVPARARSLVITVGSWAFYAWWRVDFLALYAAVTVWTYGFGALIAAAPDPRSALRRTAFGVAGSLAVLAYFKYYGFFAVSFAETFGLDPATSFFVLNVILPIGVSFFVFESISYMVDIYRKDAEPAQSFVDFAAFLALFPHLIAGPVMRYKDLAAQITWRSHTVAKFSAGCTLFMIGLAKKVLIADSVAPIADGLFSLAVPSLMDAWLAAIAFSVQLYFDFSGYSDMAVGLGLMIGFRLVRNFHFPYVSRSITEFWRRWHISLSLWLRDYLYIPLGGSRKGPLRTYFNLFVTMVLGGFWHGANWTFLIWGAWHGALLAIERLLGARSGRRMAVAGETADQHRGAGDRSPWPRAIALPLTLLFVVIGWVMFRAPDVASAFGLYGGMIGLNGLWLSTDADWRLARFDLAVLVIGVLIVFIEPKLTKRFWAGRGTGLQLDATMASLALVILAAASVLKLSADAYSPFLYFQF